MEEDVRKSGMKNENNTDSQDEGVFYLYYR